MVTDTGEQQQTPRSRRYAPQQQEGQREPRRPFGPTPPRKICAFCQDKNLRFDYKQSEMLRRYISDRGKILPRRATGVCARHQRRLALAIKRARHLALLPYTAEHLRKG